MGNSRFSTVQVSTPYKKGLQMSQDLKKTNFDVLYSTKSVIIQEVSLEHDALLGSGLSLFGREDFGESLADCGVRV